MKRAHLVSIFIALSGFLLPVCFVDWSTMTLEVFGRWLVFPWWIYDSWSNRFEFLAPSYYGYRVFSRMLWTIPVLYTAIAIALSVNNELSCRGQERWASALSVIITVLAIQTVWPTLVFLVFNGWGVFVLFFAPLPLSSLVALIGLAWVLVERRRNVVFISEATESKV